MNELRSEIEKRFALQSDYSAYKLQQLDAYYPAWVIRSANGEYGVAVEYDGDAISERFSGATIESRSLSINTDITKNYLTLSCQNKHLRKQFSVLCEEFLDPGESGEKRRSLLDDPLEWWKEWKELLGNKQSEDLIYDIGGKLMALLKLCQEGRTDAYWTASRMKTHDIELEDMSYEIKSSVKKEVATIHVSSQFQLKSEKPLYLIFTRLEESETGKSIDDLLVEISGYQYQNASDYNRYLESRNLNTGNHGRKRRFIILERRRYTVDDAFPLIREELFKAGRLPDGITHLEYDVNLDGIPYENWK